MVARCSLFSGGHTYRSSTLSGDKSYLHLTDSLMTFQSESSSEILKTKPSKSDPSSTSHLKWWLVCKELWLTLCLAICPQGTASTFQSLRALCSQGLAPASSVFWLPCFNQNSPFESSSPQMLLFYEVLQSTNQQLTFTNVFTLYSDW